MVQDNQTLNENWALVIDDRASEMVFTKEDEKIIEQMRKTARESLRKRRKTPNATA